MPTPEQIAALRAVARACLETLTFEEECPVCGGDWMDVGHDDECELIALVRAYPEINQAGHRSYLFVLPERLRTEREVQELRDVGD